MKIKIKKINKKNDLKNNNIYTSLIFMFFY